MTEKSFDIKSPTNGLPITDGLVDPELAGASTTGQPEVHVDPDAATAVFPMSFDRDVNKDFRPQEVQERQQAPKGSYAPNFVSEGEHSLTSPTGLEDVSSDDMETLAPTSAEKAT